MTPTDFDRSLISALATGAIHTLRILSLDPTLLSSVPAPFTLSWSVELSSEAAAISQESRAVALMPPLPVPGWTTRVVRSGRTLVISTSWSSPV